jgi:glycosyltransferase involved in cell wall biosynthesis
MKILMLSATFPYPPTRGGTQVRTYNLIKYLAKNHDITVMTRPTGDVTSEEIQSLGDLVKELKVFPRLQEASPSIFSKINRLSEFMAKGTPPNVRSLYHPDIQLWLDQAIAANRFDVITCEHSVNEIFIRPDWGEKLKTVVNIHSSLYNTCKNQLETGISEKPLRDYLYLPLLERYERQFCQKFNAIVVTTAEDQEQIEALKTDRSVTVIPNGVDLEVFPYRSIDPSGYQLIIAGGMDYSANIDSARFLGLEIFPILQEKYADATLMIVGSNPAPSVLELMKNPQITVTGRVPSMVEYLHQATVCVVPSRAGFGIKNKTLEAMAAGVPVVASDRGLEGLNVDGENAPLRALRANHVEEYVTAIGRLFESAELRDTLSWNGRTFIEDHYTWEQAGTKYERVLTDTF